MFNTAQPVLPVGEAFFSNSRGGSPQKKKKKNPGSIHFSWISTKSPWGLFWAETHPPSTFQGNLFTSICVILLTNQPTNQQTDTGEEDNLVGRGKMLWEPLFFL